MLALDGVPLRHQPSRLNFGVTVTTFAFAATTIVALLYLGFLYLETLGWNDMVEELDESREYANTTRLLALN